MKKYKIQNNTKEAIIVDSLVFHQEKTHMIFGFADDDTFLCSWKWSDFVAAIKLYQGQEKVLLFISKCSYYKGLRMPTSEILKFWDEVAQIKNLIE